MFLTHALLLLESCRINFEEQTLLYFYFKFKIHVLLCSMLRKTSPQPLLQFVGESDQTILTVYAHVCLAGGVLSPSPAGDRDGGVGFRCATLEGRGDSAVHGTHFCLCCFVCVVGDIKAVFC